MKSTPRQEALRSLRAMLEETTQAQQLVSTGQAISAMRVLLRARRLGKKAIVALMGGCLNAVASPTDRASLVQLAELIVFAQQTLCPNCRSEVGKRWKEAEGCDPCDLL